MHTSKKKILTLLFIGILMSVLTSCSGISTRKKENVPADTEAKKEIEELEQQDSPSKNAVIPSLESPAQIGEWIPTRRYNVEIHDYSVVYLRIDEILRDPEAVSYILKQYNNEHHAIAFPNLKDKTLEYCIIKYEVMFPDYFQADENSITFADMNFFIRLPDGTDYIAEDDPEKNLSEVYDISPKITAPLSPGDTFSTGKAVFIMKKNEHNYLIENNYYINKECFSYYYKGI